MNLIIIVNQKNAPNTVKNLSTHEMGLGQGTNHLIATETCGIDGSDVQMNTIGKRGTIPTTTSAIPAVNFVNSVKRASKEISSEGSRNTTVMFIFLMQNRKYSNTNPRISYTVVPSSFVSVLIKLT